MDRNFKAYLSANDHPQVGCSYRTTRNDNEKISIENDEQFVDNLETSLKLNDRGKIAERYCRIKSQSLVDSNNEESSDGDTIGASMARLSIEADRSTIADNVQIPISGSQSQLDDELVVVVERERVNKKRSSWRRQSLMNRWQAVVRQQSSFGDRIDDRIMDLNYDEQLEADNNIGSSGGIVVASEQNNGTNDNTHQIGARNFDKPLDQDHDQQRESIIIKVEQYNSLDGWEKGSNRLLGCECVDSIQQQNRTLDKLMHLNAATGISSPPEPPPPSRSSSTLDLTNHQHGLSCCRRSLTNMSQWKPVTRSAGSLSDHSHQMQSMARRIYSDSQAYERKQMEQRLESWKRSNKIIGHIRENPFNMHLDYLDKLNQVDRLVGAASSNRSPTPAHDDDDDDKEECLDATNQESQQQQAQVNHHHRQDQPDGPAGANRTQQECLNECAAHLSYLYRKNQTSMDNNSDFRNLLYNIICCLLVQDEQVLSTPSVGKVLDIIRAYLESASRVYSTASTSLMVSTSASLSSQSATTGVTTGHCELDTGQRAHNLERVSCTSSPNCTTTGQLDRVDPLLALGGERANWPRQDDQSALAACNGTTRAGTLATDRRETNHSTMKVCRDESSRSQKPADFRRISSVSYNDEHLINDLCANQHRYDPTGRSGSLSAGRESPWGYQELSAERQHPSGSTTSQHYTSQSSLEQTNVLQQHQQQQHNGSNHDTTNDSGNGTMYESQVTSDFATMTSRSSSSADMMHKSSARAPPPAHRSALICDFRPKQQPAYVSTDDCVSKRTSIGDADCSSALHELNIWPDQGQRDAVDVASRRAELEWTLNKLINFELKHTWLTSNDTLRRAIRKVGVPNEIRGKVWLILIEQMIGTKYDAAKLLGEASKTIDAGEQNNGLVDEETQSILKQIELDVNRTMPGHKLFDDGAEGGIKLRRILVAYSIHVNRAIAYCQGFNFIVALMLTVFEGDEENALRGFICIVDHIFPSKYYFDHYLTGARADQFLLADFICDQLIKSPTMADRKMIEGVTSSITLNWFISLFHGAVPTLTRLTILDHFMLEGVKALFRFTMAILYLAFQVAPPSSCEVFAAIRNTAKHLYDVKLLLSIVNQIKLPKDSYFAIRRSFYMLQSSFNSDQFYMQTLSNKAKRHSAPNKPLSVQQQQAGAHTTKPPALSFIAASTHLADHHHHHFTISNSICQDNMHAPRVCISADRTKVCLQSIGKLGRSHIKVMDANVKSYERSLMSPLRNCIIIGISNCGKNLIAARQSSRRNFKTLREQDLNFYIHELSTEIFDGFYIEHSRLALVLTHQGEVLKIDTTKSMANNPGACAHSAETLMLRDNYSIGEHDKLKLRLASMDTLTNLLWIYVECEHSPPLAGAGAGATKEHHYQLGLPDSGVASINVGPKANKFKHNNPFLCDTDDLASSITEAQQQVRSNAPGRKIIMIDIITFDIFSAFSVHASFGELTNLRTALVGFCQLANPMSSQFSSRIVQIGPTGRYEQLLSFSDVVDYMVTVPESYKQKLKPDTKREKKASSQRYSTLRRLLTHSRSLNNEDGGAQALASQEEDGDSRWASTSGGGGTLTSYYRSLMKSHSSAVDNNMADDKYVGSCWPDTLDSSQEAWWPSRASELKDASGADRQRQQQQQQQSCAPKTIQDNTLRSMIASSLGVGGPGGVSGTNYVPVNMAFIFRNGKIALFEFTESYAIHTRESQLDRYDYSKVLDVSKSGDVFIVTILTVFDKLIKVVI